MICILVELVFAKLGGVFFFVTRVRVKEKAVCTENRAEGVMQRVLQRNCTEVIFLYGKKNENMSVQIRNLWFIFIAM